MAMIGVTLYVCVQVEDNLNFAKTNEIGKYLQNTMNIRYHAIT